MRCLHWGEAPWCSASWQRQSFARTVAKSYRIWDDHTCLWAGRQGGAGQGHCGQLCKACLSPHYPSPRAPSIPPCKSQASRGTWLASRAGAGAHQQISASGCFPSNSLTAKAFILWEDWLAFVAVLPCHRDLHTSGKTWPWLYVECWSGVELPRWPSSLAPNPCPQGLPGQPRIYRMSYSWIAPWQSCLVFILWGHLLAIIQNKGNSRGRKGVFFKKI